jgi:menaquinol-cytochrome c reductase iron-sulfur subunit
MQRRSFLEWAIKGMSAIVAAIVGVPALAYLTDSRNRPARQTGLRTVAKLSDLQVGVPREIVIRETSRDAWNLHPDEIVGRVWLVRKGNDDVEAFTNICPHLGCSVARSDGGFLCPCHGGQFNIDGQRIHPQEGSNPAPRDMDRLAVVKAPAAGQPGDFDIKVEYKRFKTSLDRAVDDD